MLLHSLLIHTYDVWPRLKVKYCTLLQRFEKDETVSKRAERSVSGSSDVTDLTEIYQNHRQRSSGKNEESFWFSP